MIAITGGGSQAIGKLLSVPGGSGSLLEAVVPYSVEALTEFLASEPDQACSESTGRAMAMAAWMRARRLGTDSRSLVGVGCTASLVSDIPKRGEHRIHTGVQTAEKTTSYSLVLLKGERTRQQEELLAAKLLLLALGEACEADTSSCHSAFESKLREGELIQHRQQAAHPTWTRLLLGEEQIVRWPPTDKKELPKVLFPGAFNPLHRGHCRMAEIAAERTGFTVACELSITNVDKPPLDFIEIAKRLHEIKSQDPERQLLLTSAPTFEEKAALVQDCIFVVGADTMLRIADSQYYDNDTTKRDKAIRRLKDAGSRFLVFGREAQGKFCSLSDLQLPSELLMLCDEVPASEFREDISSTALREK